MAEAADFQGTSASPARRWLRRGGALLAGAPLLAGLFLPLGTPAQAAEKAAVADAAGSGGVDISIDSLTPSAPADGDTVTVAGSVTNRTKQTVTDAHVGIRVGSSPLATRSAIDTAARLTSFQPGLDAAEVGGKYVAKVTRLAAGSSQNFSISVPVKDLDLGDEGVYQLGVSLTGRTTARPWDQVLGIKRTFLPWQPDTADTKTKTTFLWPLISTVHLTAETGSDKQQTPVFKNDDLAKAISPGGRLDQLLSLGSGLDVTWVLDPDLLASVDAMRGGYRIQQADGTTVAGNNQDVAKTWLDKLEKTVQGQKIVALPFADPDIASLAHTGRSVAGSLSHLKDATDVAASTVETIVHVKPSTDFAWPAEGAIDPSIVKVATSAGADTVIARSDSLRETGNLSYTPNAARPIGGGTTAVVADERLSTAFQGDMLNAGTSTLAVQTFLAQSLMINLQDSAQRSVVVAPQRMPSASQAQTMAEALRALQRGGWSENQGLAAAAKAKPDPRATTRVPSASSYPSALKKQQLSAAAFEWMQSTQSTLDRFKVILTDQSRVVTPFGRAIDRGMSTSWRGRSAEGETFREGVNSYLDGLTGLVHLIKKSDAKLSGRSATIPVTVQNNLVQGVDNLVLRLTSQQPTRLKIGDGPYDEQPIRVAGEHSQSVKFTTSTKANGPVKVVAQLYTEDGQPYGDPVPFEVKVTEITSTVMLVIGGGVLLLVLAGFRMYTQRKRAAARQGEDGPDAGPGADAVNEDADADADGTVDTGDAEDTGVTPGNTAGPAYGAEGPGQPSDPTPDTAPESTDPSGTGERVDR